MSLHEECGVFGVIAPEPCDVASISYYGCKGTCVLFLKTSGNGRLSLTRNEIHG